VQITGQAVVLIARWEMGRESQPGLHGQGMNGLKALKVLVSGYNSKAVTNGSSADPEVVVGL